MGTGRDKSEEYFMSLIFQEYGDIIEIMCKSNVCKLDKCH